MSDRAKYWAKVGGIIHTDELPKYGISKREVREIREKMKAEVEDAIVIVVDKKERCIQALKAVTERAKEALKGVPEETRAINPDGTTHYSRPMPGSARMYPETDVRPIIIREDELENLRKNLPELPEERRRRYVKEYGLSEKLAEEMATSSKATLFEEIISENRISPTLVASTLTYTLNTLKNERIPIERISTEKIKEIFKLISKERIAKETIPNILRYSAENPEKDVNEIVQTLGLEKITKKELTEIIRREIEESEELIKKRGAKAMSPIMGRIMSKLRGKADGGTISQIVKKMILEKMKTTEEH